MRMAAALMLCVSALGGGATAAPQSYTPWPDRVVPSTETEWLELAQKSCCKRCTKGQPCGNTCISKKSTCRSAPGCAC